MKLQLVLILAAIVVLSPAPTMAQAIFTHVSGTAGPDAFIALGTVECPGGSPTGLFPFGPPCTPGSRVNIRGLVVQSQWVATDSRVTGVFTNVFSGNFDGWTQWGPGSGHVWGACSLAVTGGGLWSGTAQGYRTVNADGVSVAFHIVMHGTGGSIEGLHLELDLIATAPAATSETFTGRILVPGGK